MQSATDSFHLKLELQTFVSNLSNVSSAFKIKHQKLHLLPFYFCSFSNSSLTGKPQHNIHRQAVLGTVKEWVEEVVV